jgi:RNA polymerase sigma-70 factor (ECF subfamily)
MDENQTLEQFEKSLREFRNQFLVITSPHRPALWSYCLKLTSSPWDAEDLVQETMLKAFSRMALLAQAVSVKAYLFRIASNTWIDRMRREKALVDEFETTDHAEAPERATDSAETREALEILLETLPPRQRITVLLVDIFDFKPSEVATMIDSTEGAVKAALHRARTSLRAQTTLDRAEVKRARTGIKPPLPVMEQYIQAFNNRDADALVRLMKEEAVNEVVGDWEEHGIAMMKESSLYYWTREKDTTWVEYGTLFGRPVLFGFRRTDEHDKALSEILALDIVDNRVVSQRWYFFSPEFIEYTAKLLGVPSKTWGYSFDLLTPENDPHTA